MDASVIMPCFNAQQWIAISLQSVAQQLDPPAEVILIDDGSTDQSIDIAQSINLPSPLRILKTDRLGGAGARNAGIRAAKARWIAFLDADDRWCPHHLNTIAQALNQTRDVGYTPCCYYTITAQSNDPIANPTPVWPVESITSGLDHRQYIRWYAGHLMFGMSSTVVDRKRLIDVGLFNESQVRRHDIEMWLRVIAGQTWTCSPLPTAMYRDDTPGAISRNIANREYFMLRALLLNRQAYDGPEMRGLIHRHARRALAAAFTDGHAEDRRAARELAIEHVNRADRLLFTAAGLCPPMFSFLNRLKRARRRRPRTAGA